MHFQLVSIFMYKNKPTPIKGLVCLFQKGLEQSGQVAKNDGLYS